MFAVNSVAVGGGGPLAWRKKRRKKQCAFRGAPSRFVCSYTKFL